jgi:methyl acetate hydrolase
VSGAALSNGRSGDGGVDITGILEVAVAHGDLLGAAAAVSTPGGISSGAAGQARPDLPMAVDTVVWIASMTKAVTGLAAMQLVEQGRLDLDAPAGDVVPYLGQLSVLDGFADDGSPLLRPPSRPVTLRHLLTHTSGFVYDWISPHLDRYLTTLDWPRQPTGLTAAYQQPLLFDPGERWSYGIGIDWVGQMIEAVTGTRADDHVASAVLEPLGMVDSGFQRGPGQRARTAAMYRRGPDGLASIPFDPTDDPEFVLAGGGLYSTVTDYLRFARAILGGGQLDGVRVVSPETVALMGQNHIGGLSADGWTSISPAFSNDVAFFPGTTQHWGLSFLINTEPTPEGRSAGSLAWAGLGNTYYWIDPARQVAGVFATQLFPFFDGPSLDAFHAVERATYSALPTAFTSG